jgi:hypothetical protein
MLSIPPVGGHDEGVLDSDGSNRFLFSPVVLNNNFIQGLGTFIQADDDRFLFIFT